jgi:hypothetical protein
MFDIKGFHCADCRASHNHSISLSGHLLCRTISSREESVENMLGISLLLLLLLLLLLTLLSYLFSFLLTHLLTHSLTHSLTRSLTH